MSSLAVGRRGLELEDLELWLAGVFSAAADLLLQLSVSVAKRVDDEEATSWSATTSPSPRSARPCCDSDHLTAAQEEVVDERVVEEAAVSTELDRRARKRYRRLSELYAATNPVASASSDAKKKKRKRSLHRHRKKSESSVEATRHGGDY